MTRTRLLCVCIIVSTLLIGCSRKPNDEVIQRDINSKIATDPQTQDSQVEVQSTKGNVKLTGKVKSDGAKKEVKKIAAEEPGVSSVDDETAVDASAAAKAAALPPAPTFSAAQKIGMFAFPKNNQNRDQQLRDELDCYNAAQQQTGISPDQLIAPTAPTSAEIQSAQKEAAESANQAKGGRVKGAAVGAAGGVAIGAIAGSAGKGAAIGAVGGTMVGGARQRKTNKQAKQEAATAAATDLQQQHEQEKAAYNNQMSTFKRAFSACLDARNYSVK